MNNYIWTLWIFSFLSTIITEFVSLKPYETPDNRSIWFIILFSQTTLWTSLIISLFVERYWFLIQEEINVCVKFIVAIFTMIYSLTLYYFKYIQPARGGDYFIFVTSIILYLFMFIVSFVYFLYKK